MPARIDLKSVNLGDSTLANTPQAKKRARQAEKRRAHNMTLRSRFRTAIKKVRAAIATNHIDQAQNALAMATPVIDGMVNKGIIHKNKAARHKSRLVHAIRKLSGATQGAQA